MTTNRNPKSMTADERRDEIAAILAGGLLRVARDDRRTVPAALPDPAKSGPIRLDLSADPPLTRPPSMLHGLLASLGRQDLDSQRSSNPAPATSRGASETGAPTGSA